MLRVLALVFAAVLAPLAHAYSLTGPKWTTTPIVMQLQLGAPPATLLDGNTTWGAVAESAFNSWNATMGGQQFSVVRDSTATRAQGNRINNVFFSPDIYGEAWGSGVLAVTLSFSSGSSRTECDVLFNTSYSWNSYPGSQRNLSSGVPLMDFRRVALHEFGHVLGLGHPDEAGQSVSAVMNSRISNIDALTADDIAGVQALYGAAAPTQPPQITSQPQNRTVSVGASVSFTVAANGGPLTFQWLKNGIAIPGATASTLTFAAVADADAATYSVKVTNAIGSVTSSGAILTVVAPVALPVIVTQPVSQVVTAGQNVTLSVRATGGGTLFYTWFRDGSPLNINAAPDLVLTAVQTWQAGTYTASVNNTAGTVTTQPATLTVRTLPEIKAINGGGTVMVGATFTLNVVTASSLPITRYQWSKNGVAIVGANAASYTVTNAQLADAGNYEVTVTSAAGSVTSGGRVDVAAPVLITQQPQSQTVAVGEPAIFSVETTNDAAVQYTWEKVGEVLWDPFNPLTNISTSKYIIPTVRPSDAGTYRVHLTTPLGTITSVSAVLTVVPAAVPPTIIELTPSQSVRLGERFSFVVNATGALSYQWRKNGVDLPGQIYPGYGMTEATVDAAGDYTVVMTNTAGTTVSPVMSLTMSYSRLSNLSARGYVPPGGALTPGFVLRSPAYGSGKRILLRGVGPALSEYGVAAPLADTKLELIMSSSYVWQSNNDWGDSQTLAPVFASVGAFPLPTDSRDAAVETGMGADAYTVRVTSNDPAAGGIALAEVYDTEPLSSATRLVNLSARGLTGPGEKVLTAGFVIVGNTAKRVLLRAIGPGLLPYGVTGVLADPRLKVMPAGSATPLAENNDWGGTDALKSAFAQAGAFTLRDASTDAAVVLTLAPGAYTVLVSGAGETSGEALVEVYDLDP
jgi:hypothetical protein